MNCDTCNLIKTRDAGTAPSWNNIIRTEFWDVVHALDTSLPGWIVIVLRRHIPSISELTEDEATELGSLIRKVSIGINEIVGCAKTYVMQFAELPNHRHVHFHVVPRMPDMPKENIGPGVFSCLGVSKEFRVSENEMNSIASKLRKFLKNRYPTS